MQDWHSTCLGRRTLPRDLSAFEIEAFFNFSEAERRVIEDRRGPALKVALALQIGFLRMPGRLLEAVRIVPPALWRHLGEQLGVAAPDLASLRSMYQRRRTLFVSISVFFGQNFSNLWPLIPRNPGPTC
jgi:hypothetical protein